MEKYLLILIKQYTVEVFNHAGVGSASE